MALAHLEFVFIGRPGARAVVGEVDASKCIRTEVVLAVHALEVVAVDGRVAGHILRLALLLLLAAAAEHLVEEAELRLDCGGEEG